MNKVDVRAMADAELASWIATQRFALFEASFRHAQGRLVNHAVLGELRKAIARGMTEAGRREVAGGLPRGSLSNQPAKAGASIGGADSGFLSQVAESFSE